MPMTPSMMAIGTGKYLGGNPVNLQGTSVIRNRGGEGQTGTVLDVPWFQSTSQSVPWSW
jgi:hypothetical protein